MSNRLEGLDVARFVALVGMVIVNFSIVMGVESGNSVFVPIVKSFEGRAAATFVVLAGVSLGLSASREISHTISVTLRRAAFLLAVGLLNMLVFDADILHYYAFYFLFGVLLVSLRTPNLILVIVWLNVAFLFMLLLFNYDAGWNWEDYTYQGFWTVRGFVRNLLFNGWHPVIPWLSFLILGVILSRASLRERRTQHYMIGIGMLVFLLTETLATVLRPLLSGIDPELSVLLSTDPIPPVPLYIISGSGVAVAVIGLCLRFTDVLRRSGLLAIASPAGRQTLTLYIAHILIGMGSLEALGMLGGQTAVTGLIASFVFCSAAMVYAVLWEARFKRGPIEIIMRKLAG